MARHAGRIAAEQPRIAPSRRRGQRDAMRPRLQRAPRLVEADVAVGADAEDLQVDAAGRRDRRLVALAFGLGVGSRAVEEADPLGRQVDAREQVLLHEDAIAAWMSRGNAGELVEVERGRAREVGLPVRVQAGELVIQPDGRAAGREAEHDARALADGRGHLHRQRAGEHPLVLKNRDFHYSALYDGMTNPPRASARARRTAPDAGSTLSCTVRLRGEACGSRRASSSSSHGTARKMPPARTKGNSEPTI